MYGDARMVPKLESDCNLQTGLLSTNSDIKD